MRATRDTGKTHPQGTCNTGTCNTTPPAFLAHLARDWAREDEREAREMAAFVRWLHARARAWAGNPTLAAAAPDLSRPGASREMAATLLAGAVGITAALAGKRVREADCR